MVFSNRVFLKRLAWALWQRNITLARGPLQRHCDTQKILQLISLLASLLMGLAEKRAKSLCKTSKESLFSAFQNAKTATRESTGAETVATSDETKSRRPRTKATALSRKPYTDHSARTSAFTPADRTLLLRDLSHTYQLEGQKENVLKMPQGIAHIAANSIRNATVSSLALFFKAFVQNMHVQVRPSKTKMKVFVRAKSCRKARKDVAHTNNSCSCRLLNMWVLMRKMRSTRSLYHQHAS